jgi:hypothetical protein
LIVPVAGTSKSLGISMTMSGWIFQPSTNCRAGAASAGLPSAAPVSAQAVNVLMSWSESLASFE